MSTYTPIASITLASASSSVTFSGIPQTYTDLVLVAAATGDRASNVDSLAIRLNSDTGSNYSYTYMAGEVSTGVISGRASSQTNIWCGNFTSNSVDNPSSIIIQIQNYSNTTTNKTTLSRGNPIAGGGYSAVNANVGLWRNTAAVTSVTVRSETGNNFRSGSTFNLYGVANASITNTAKATGGDSVYTDGTYWYHIFRSSGTFAPTQALNCDYLVVAGGGGGGVAVGNYTNAGTGGGGAGGFRTSIGGSALSLTAQNYTVTVGAGGGEGSSGSNSVFSSITSTGGGRGGSYASAAGVSGGSGGGGASDGGSGGGGGTGTAGQGNNGGNGGSGSIAASGGGGGAGGTGGNASGTTAGAAGAGSSSSITGTSVTYAAGGAGSYGAYTPVNGAGNTGTGGDGGVNNRAPGASGGSGIVVVRYAV